MDSIHIKGGIPLSGEVRVHGAKNAVLPILIATAGISGVFTLRHCPRIRDVELTREILADLGVKTVWEDDVLRVDSRERCCAPVRAEPASSFRASCLFLGVLTGAWGRAEVPFPGGCHLSFGNRPLDLHLDAFCSLGAAPTIYQADEDDDVLTIRCQGRPRAGTVTLSFPSVGATENVILAALGADGPVRLLGAACEPEIDDLAEFLNACGADVRGAGTSEIEIRPAPLHGADHTILPDRIEAVTWLCAAACTGGQITLRDVRPDLLRPVLEVLRKAGCSITADGDRISLQAGALHGVGSVSTGPYPAFPTDAQPLVTAVLTRAKGLTVMRDTVFRFRFLYARGLTAMGADVKVFDGRARIRGVDRLHGAQVEATDLRGGAALLCAALGAEGESLLTNAALLERGYQDLIPTLRSLGADVQSNES